MLLIVLMQVYYVILICLRELVRSLDKSIMLKRIRLVAKLNLVRLYTTILLSMYKTKRRIKEAISCTKNCVEQ